MKNYYAHEQFLEFQPFHEDNICGRLMIDYLNTDVFRDGGEQLIVINIADETFTMEEAQAKQLRDFLNKNLED